MYNIPFEEKFMSIKINEKPVSQYSNTELLALAGKGIAGKKRVRAQHELEKRGVNVAAELAKKEQ